MKNEQKKKLLNTLRKARLEIVRDEMAQHDSADRLRRRLRTNMLKEHAELGRIAAKALGIEMETLRREHEKADELIIRHMKAERKRMKSTASEVRRDYRRKLAQGLRSSASLRAADRDKLTCLWRAQSTDTFHWGDDAYKEQINFNYGLSDGRNEINFFIGTRYKGNSASGGAYDYNFNFYYEQESNGIIQIDSFVGSNGFLTTRSSLANVCCGGYKPPTSAFIRLTARIRASTVDVYGNPQVYDPLEIDLGNCSSTGQDFDEERVKAQIAMEYPYYVPVVGGIPVVISVGVNIFFSIFTDGEAEAEFYTPSSFEVEVPYVIVRSV